MLCYIALQPPIVTDYRFATTVYIGFHSIHFDQNDIPSLFTLFGHIRVNKTSRFLLNTLI